MEPIVENTPNTETVRWAYRFILGREPENEAVLTHWASQTDGRVLLAYFVQAPEAVAHRAAGFPAHGAWISRPLTAQALQAACHLRFNAVLSAEEIAAELSLYPSLAALRRALLASPEYRAAATVKLRPTQPAPARPAPPEATKPGAAPPEATNPEATNPEATNPGQHEFSILGKRFTLRGAPRDEYWRSLVEGAPDPSLERLARLAKAAFPDGGAGRVLVDVGASMGLTSLAMGIGAPYHADLLCFEPDDRNHGLLQQNLAANGLDRARFRAEALAERDGTARLRRDADNTAITVLVEPHSRAQSAGALFKEVPVRRLDTVLAEQGITRLDLMKIDVEGGETSVMLGASEALTRDKPFIFVEFNLWTQMTVGARNPMEVLEEWRAAFRHMVAFGPEGRPVPITDHDGLLWILHTTMTERGCADDLILCDRLDWLERWN